MGFTFTLKGVSQMLSELASLEAQMQDDVIVALRLEAEEIMRRSKTEFVPIDQSTLMLSGFVNDVVRKGDDVIVTMGFGGDAKSYTLAIHETPSSHDPPSWKGVSVQFKRGGPKYLERPLMEATQGMADRIAKKVKPK